MINKREDIIHLRNKLESLLKRQDAFSREINDLKIKIDKLQTSESGQSTEKEGWKKEKLASASNFEITEEQISTEGQNKQQQKTKESQKQTIHPIKKPRKIRTDLEKFIGENLINKIGIAITIIGVAIGAKYSIEHDLISPITRIVLGYLTGMVLLGFGMKLKKKYKNFSAVLVSGAMAINYFITFSAYSFYDLLPQAGASGLMLIFTAFTVLAAINYDKQIIAHIGLVGAYAVPFLLSENSEKITTLFAYMAIINIGILVIAFKKYWKPLYYSSFGLTWVIYFLWYSSSYNAYENFRLALIFLSLFFGIFYLTFLSYKLLQKDKFKNGDIILLLANTIIFYGIGYSILNNHKAGEELLGVFTLFNAIVHFVVSVIIYRQMLADQNIFYFVSGLVLVFITITIPVQLDGNWVTLLWVGEAALLFWIGRTKNIPVYEKLSYPLMILAFFSIAHDWMSVYDSYDPENPESKITPLLNTNFLTSILFVATFSFINILNRTKEYSSKLISKKGISKMISFSIPTILLVAAYCTFRVEIANYWNQIYAESILLLDTEGEQSPNYYRFYDLKKIKTIWIINYSLLFFSLLAFFNFKKLKSQKLGLINLYLITITLVVFLIQGLYNLGELQQSYLNQITSQDYQISVFNIGIRYISFAFVALALVTSYKYLQQEFVQRNFNITFDILSHTIILWIASSELINWMEITETTQSNKLGLSILWGTYSLFLISLGIWKKKKHLRVGAIVLFGVTLIKLFFYDISELDTIAKTIVFVSLGVLMLIISFLYNKFKYIISDEKPH